MPIYSRPFEKGDEVDINKLYHTLTGLTRSLEEYNWEWINTWDNQGSSWLMFDDSREDNNQLICQYSLIPTSFSFYGQKLNAGKTENCMSHPDFRGKRIYFPHEKKYFEKAKLRFDIFFTTTGQGAPGKVRRKLGYVALDYWMSYNYFFNRKSIYNYLVSEFASKKSYITTKQKTVFTIASFYFYSIQKIKSVYSKNKIDNELKVKHFNSTNSPINEIEAFWNLNKEQYKITVDRNKSYLKWRLDENPYLDYQYLTLYSNNILVGYIIYSFFNNKCIIEDIIAKNVDYTIFNQLIIRLKDKLHKSTIQSITCSTLQNNLILKKVFFYTNFVKLDFSKIKNLLSKKGVENRPFHSYINPQIDKNNIGVNPENWFITALVKEGKYI